MKIWSLPLKKGRWTWRIWRTRRTASHSEMFWQDPPALCPFGQSECSEYCNGWTKGNSSVRSQTISNADSSIFSIHINREKIAKQRKFKKPDGVMVHNWVHSSLWWWCRRPRSRRRTTSQAGFWLIKKEWVKRQCQCSGWWKCCWFPLACQVGLQRPWRPASEKKIGGLGAGEVKHGSKYKKSPQHGERARKSWDALFEASKDHWHTIYIDDPDIPVVLAMED